MLSGFDWKGFVREYNRTSYSRSNSNLGLIPSDVEPKITQASYGFIRLDFQGQVYYTIPVGGAGQASPSYASHEVVEAQEGA